MTKKKTEENETKTNPQKSKSCKCKVKQVEAVKEKTPYEIWEDCWALSCDHKAYPEAWQSWNGAVEVITAYMVEQLLGEGWTQSYEETLALRDKIRAKFIDL
jgi:hypothetical protein